MMSNMTVDYTEPECKLSCLCRTAEKAICLLLKCLSKKCNIAQSFTSDDDRGKALAEILRSSNMEIRVKKTLRLNTAFTTNSNFNSNINYDSEDLTPLCQILLDVHAYPTCGKRFVRHNRSCTCNCETVCCDICLNCSSCNPACTLSFLRNHVSDICNLRNMRSHYTQEKSKLLANHLSNDPNGDEATKWKNNLKKWKKALHTVLDFLNTHNCLSEEDWEAEKAQVILIINRTKDHYLSIFYPNMQFRPFETVIKNMEIHFDLSKEFKKLKDFKDINSQNSKLLAGNFEVKAADLLKSTFQIEVGVKLSGMTYIFPYDPKVLQFTVQIKSEKVDIPSCFQSMTTKESESLKYRLTQEMNILLSNIVRGKVHVTCQGWKFSSIIIDFIVMPEETNLPEDKLEMIKKSISNIHTNPCILALIKQHQLDTCKILVSWPSIAHNEILNVCFTVTFSEKLKAIDDTLNIVKEDFKKHVFELLQQDDIFKQPTRKEEKPENEEKRLVHNVPDQTIHMYHLKIDEASHSNDDIVKNLVETYPSSFGKVSVFDRGHTLFMWYPLPCNQMVFLLNEEEKDETKSCEATLIWIGQMSLLDLSLSVTSLASYQDKLEKAHQLRFFPIPKRLLRSDGWAAVGFIDKTWVNFQEENILRRWKTFYHDDGKMPFYDGKMKFEIKYEDGETDQDILTRRPGGFFDVNNAMEKLSIEHWGIILYDVSIEQDSIKKFKEALKRSCNEIGLRLSKPDFEKNVLKGTSPEVVLNEEVKSNLQFILVVLPDNVSFYEQFKMCSAGLSTPLVVQGIRIINLLNCKKEVIKSLSWEIFGKFNAVKREKPKEIIRPSKILYEPTLFLGVSITTQDSEQCPSIITVVGSVDHYPLRYSASYYFQDHSLNYVKDLKLAIVKHLYMFACYINKKPTKVIIYRSPILENDLQLVSHRELASIQSACREFGGENYQPGIAYIVVYKRNDLKCQARKQSDYYQYSHPGYEKSVSSLYKVLLDDNDFTEEELSQISFMLCHLHIRAKKSTSIPAPVYYARLYGQRLKYSLMKCPDIREQKNEAELKSEVMDTHYLVSCYPWVLVPC